METEIYYFSGTGNSYYVASQISQKLNAPMKPIIPFLNKDNIASGAKTIGFIFPIYDFKAPKIVDDFITKLKTPEHTYFFAICTYGVMPLNTMKKIEKTLHLKNKKLSAGFTVKMPHNGLGYSKIPVEKQKKMFTDFETKSESIVQYVQSQKHGLIEKNSYLDYLLLIGILIRMMSKIIPMLAQALKKGWDSLGFYADEKCNSCGICTMICPVENIKMIDNKPCWNDNCLNCFACIHWCPEQSIQIANLTKNMQRYHHPHVVFNDILKQKQENE